MSDDAELNCRRCTGTDVVNIQGYVLCRHAKVTSRCRVMEHLRHTLPDASDCGATLPAIQGDTLSQRNKVCLGRHTWGAMPFWALGESLPLCSSSLSGAGPAVSHPRCWPSRSERVAFLVFSCQLFDIVMHGSNLGIYFTK